MDASTRATTYPEPPLAALRAEMLGALAAVPVLALRLSLETPGIRATVPLLRGVWGAALHRLDGRAYAEVFEGRGADGKAAVPAYILRPAAPDPRDAPALDFILMGHRAIAHRVALMRAWDVASGMGLGPERHPFRIRAIQVYGPDGACRPEAHTPAPFSLERVPWPLPGDPGATACALVFDAPLRLTRMKGNVLIEAPELQDIALTLWRRIERFAGPRGAEAYKALRQAIDHIPQGPWEGGRRDFQRSGRSKGPLRLYAVAGKLPLPAGPGPLAPLLAAAQWLHIGKATTNGLGQVHIQGAVTVNTEAPCTLAAPLGQDSRTGESDDYM